MTADLRVRPAVPADLDAVLAFGAAVAPPHYEPILGRDAARQQVEQWWTAERMRPAIAAGDVLVAEVDGGLVGVSERGRWDGDVVIWKLYVAADHRGRGIGRSLLQATIDGLPDDVPRVVLEHVAGNVRAAAFYEREGFRHLRTDPAASGDPAAATVWRVRERP